MKKFIIYTILGLFGTAFLLPSCTGDFEEMNTNPNEPTLVPPEVIFPYATREGIDRIHGHRSRLERLGLDGGMLWVQYFARNQYTNEGDTYNPDASMRNNNWEGFYNESIINFQKVIDLTSDPEGQYYNENYTAIAMTMRAYLFAIVTDTWGSIPYSDALKGSTENNLAPAYDSQESIYAGLLADLKMAADMLDPAGKRLPGDILFDGDILRWQKFTNSLRLRLANRQAAKKAAESKAVFTEIMGDPAAYPIFTSNDDFAALNHEARLNSNNNNAWHDVMVISAREDWSISQTLIDAMTDGEGRPTDPRITVYAEPSLAGPMAGGYTGAPNGLPEANASVYINTASRPGSWFTQEKAPFFIMTYSELLFTLAEAALDGDYTGGETAMTYLEMAIKASFEQYGLEMPAGYTDGMTADKETIMTEKWKALFSQGIEAWTEYRRTGYPVLPEAHPDAIFENDGQVPTRLRYPESEYSLNGANVAQGASLNGGSDDKLTKLWWAE
ncbi:SusD/RagB family nutrient-binding outer membrane lipoprotein [Flavilitoribacter nigricans]|uniref:SusD/RagB family nutrient-binding outer membrane lipoprotein n=1 Tax=Flavilitoribacter nigricans (strain ATCC 23147 / DSM 23189 / NBRC 102662 / NCIMB 1420 / SS-2) TaxID=1122177 RepID=A0A2D0NFW7_FLAN2|nr:SusD/RagB family nutrient-binding outer membrane lipoprotein [Flavilitoribacter nigricans]PHN07280.1 SusD/RagB family nutrient-binding outer membrane lipoprotein [Flavilitoribacter nigricans DSM 23189 = NBRC 102662]